MKVRRQKRCRRAVRFYKACFGFREPFKVLCDGNFQHFIHERKLGNGDIPSLLSQTLGGPAKGFTTRCINAELKKLGKNYSGTLAAGRNLYLAKCDHEPVKPGSDCLESLVGGNNPDHFFVATLDVDLRRKCRIMPGCALVFAKDTSLFVEPPSEFQVEFSRAGEAQRESLSTKAVQQCIVEHDADEEDTGKTEKQSKSLGIRERPTFKRNRARGPNPLSCKKKQQKPAPAAQLKSRSSTEQREKLVQGTAEQQQPKQQQPKQPKRRRNRRKSSSAPAAADEAQHQDPDQA